MAAPCGSTLPLQNAAPVDSSADSALVRFEQGRTLAAARLRTLAEQLRGEGRGAEAGIFDAQALLAEDDYLSEGVTQRIREESATLETALNATVGEMRNALLALDDPYLRARAADIDAVGHEIQLGLGGEHTSTVLAPGSIIIADDLTPSQTAALRGGAIAGFANCIRRANRPHGDSGPFDGHPRRRWPGRGAAYRC